MYAVEFEAKISDGIVRIPDRYRALYNNQHAKVIIMVDEAEETKVTTALEQFLQKGQKTERITAFDRDQLHGR